MTKKKIIVGIVGCVCLIVLGMAVCFTQKVFFEDTNMAKIIALNCEKHNYGEVTPKDIEKIEHLNIGYTTTFTTLKDIQKCKNLETLAVGTPYNMQKIYNAFYSHIYILREKEDEVSIARLERELTEILQNCRKLKNLKIGNAEESLDLQDLTFLYDGNRIEYLEIENMTNLDLSALKNCKNLKTLVISDCNCSHYEVIAELKKMEYLRIVNSNIEEAEPILQLDYLQNITLDNTPLAEKEEEMNKIQESFPKASILY